MLEVDVEKARAAWYKHLVINEEASSPIMCSLLSDPKEISLVKDVAKLALSAWCCALWEEQERAIGTNLNYEQVCVVHLAQ